MKNRVLTNGFRNIRRSIPRFLSLFIMSLLGVFVFVGLKSTAPDMLKTLDRYLDRADGYDLKIVSGQGLTSDDVSALKDVAGIEEAEGVRTCDLLFSIGEDQYVLRVSSMPEKINRLNLIEGAFRKKQRDRRRRKPAFQKRTASQRSDCPARRRSERKRIHHRGNG